MKLRTWIGTRGDLVLAVALAIAALTQAAVSPIASVPLGVLIALLTTAPVAMRRTHPIVAALVTTAAGLIPSNGYVYVGYVVSFIVFYSVAAYVPQWRRVAAVVAAGVVLAVLGSAIHGAVFGDYFGALSAVVAPAVVGRFVRHQREQSRRLQELTGQLERERELNVARARLPMSGLGLRASSTTWSPTRSAWSRSRPTRPRPRSTQTPPARVHRFRRSGARRQRPSPRCVAYLPFCAPTNRPANSRPRPALTGCRL